MSYTVLLLDIVRLIGRPGDHHRGFFISGAQEKRWFPQCDIGVEQLLYIVRSRCYSSDERSVESTCQSQSPN